MADIFSMNKKLRNMLVEMIREPFAWPGGYEKVLILADGAVLCRECCRKEARRIMSDIRDGYDTGWLPAGISTVELLDGEPVQCGNCDREIS